MTVETSKAAQTAESGGDWDKRGPDFETILVGAVTESIVDSDRVVRLDWRNGFPNWAIYRTRLAGDVHLQEQLFCFCVGFAIAYGQEGGVSRKVASDELGYAAGRDAYNRIVNKDWEFTATDVATALGVDPKTYRKLRNGTYARLIASMDEYWIRMQVAIRQVFIVNRKIAAPTPHVQLSDGRGFGHEMDLVGDGAFRAMPHGSGC